MRQSRNRQTGRRPLHSMKRYEIEHRACEILAAWNDDGDHEVDCACWRCINRLHLWVWMTLHERKVRDD